MELTENELISWAENYKPEENSLQLSEAVFIEDLSKYISVILARVKGKKEGLVYEAARDDLLELWQKVNS